MEKVKLFCIPYSGGSSSIFLKWRKYLSRNIELLPLELAGRGSRLNEPYYNSVEEAVGDLYNSIEKEIRSATSYAIWGHSLGGIIAYELANRIYKKAVQYPCHLFFSGVKAPNINNKQSLIHSLSNHMLMQKILEYGGTPIEFLNDKAFLDIYLPIIRADIRIFEEYSFQKADTRLKCDLSVINGKNDVYVLEKALAWRDLTDYNCNFYIIEGNHFFINTYPERVGDIINDTLLKH